MSLTCTPIAEPCPYLALLVAELSLLTGGPFCRYQDIISLTGYLLSIIISIIKVSTYLALLVAELDRLLDLSLSVHVGLAPLPQDGAVNLYVVAADFILSRNQRTIWIWKENLYFSIYFKGRAGIIYSLRK